MSLSICLGKRSQIFTATGKDGKCHYCKKGVGQVYQSEDNGYTSLCYEALSSFHPYAMAFLYHGAKKTKKVRLYCPGSENYIEVEVSVYERLIPPFSFLKNVALFFINKFISFDFPTVRIRVKVINVYGECAAAHKKGDKFYFTLAYKYNIFGDKIQMCPAASFGIYPVMLAAYKTGKVYEAHCPDSVGISFKIEEGK